MRLHSLSIKIGAVITTVCLKLLRRSRIETMRLRIQWGGNTFYYYNLGRLYWSRIVMRLYCLEYDNSTIVVYVHIQYRFLFIKHSFTPLCFKILDHQYIYVCVCVISW
jgi:hypothetical protein